MLCSLRKGVLKFFWKDYNETPAELQHSCFPVNFANFLRTPLLQNTSGPLLQEIPNFLSFLQEFCDAFWICGTAVLSCWLKCLRIRNTYPEVFWKTFFCKSLNKSGRLKLKLSLTCMMLNNDHTDFKPVFILQDF